MGSLFSSAHKREDIEMACQGQAACFLQPCCGFQDYYKRIIRVACNVDGFYRCKTYCGYCNKVKQLFSQLKVTYKVIELDEESDGDEVQTALAEWTGQRTVPNVFINGKHIGGSDAVVAKHQQGELVSLLAEAGAIPKQSTQL
ncbi:UNVERIFIED_CONTAM: Glutaredoxin [Sesamum calycinum]|uniref:Glutaredoxin n=1 Tax=Sesamum calycinum TaxID=2727403 RepID=A0AAW2NCJ5_9LAMI